MEINDTDSSDERRAASGISALREQIFLLAVILCAGIFNITTIRSGQIWSDDVGQYLQHAKNLATAAPYEQTTFVIHPGIWTPGPKAYPPVFPLILSAVYCLRGADFHLMKVEIVVTLLFGLAAVFFAFRNENDLTTRLVAVAFIGFNPIIWEYKDNLMPDVSFVFVLYLALAAMSAALQDSEPTRRAWTTAVLAGLLCYAAYATKATAM